MEIVEISDPASASASFYFSTENSTRNGSRGLIFITKTLGGERREVLEYKQWESRRGVRSRIGRRKGRVGRKGKRTSGKVGWYIPGDTDILSWVTDN